MPSAADALSAPGTEAVKSARWVMMRKIRGIPRRACILGENDDAPILHGVAELTEAAWALIHMVEDGVLHDTKAFLGAASELKFILNDHGCHSDTVMPTSFELVAKYKIEHHINDSEFVDWFNHYGYPEEDANVHCSRYLELLQNYVEERDSQNDYD